MRPRKNAWLFAGGFALWGLAVAAGFHWMMRWESIPGNKASAGAFKPISDSKPLLIVALHSQCPCSLATVANLAQLTTAERNGLRLRFALTGPDAKHSPVFSKAKPLAGAVCEFLSEDEILRKYGARTSGQAFLYDKGGRLVFSGGLTNSRGLEGDSPGMQAIRQTLAGQPCIHAAPVYGCALQTTQVKT